MGQSQASRFWRWTKLLRVRNNIHFGVSISLKLSFPNAWTFYMQFKNINLKFRPRYLFNFCLSSIWWCQRHRNDKRHLKEIPECSVSTSQDNQCSLYPSWKKQPKLVICCPRLVELVRLVGYELLVNPLNQGSPSSVLEGRCPAEFSSNLNQTHLKQLIKLLLGILETSREVCWGKFELNSAGHRPSRIKFDDPCAKPSKPANFNRLGGQLNRSKPANLNRLGGQLNRSKPANLNRLGGQLNHLNQLTWTDLEAS